MIDAGVADKANSSRRSSAEKYLQVRNVPRKLTSITSLKSSILKVFEAQPTEKSVDGPSRDTYTSLPYIAKDAPCDIF